VEHGGDAVAVFRCRLVERCADGLGSPLIVPHFMTLYVSVHASVIGEFTYRPAAAKAITIEATSGSIDKLPQRAAPKHGGVWGAKCLQNCFRLKPDDASGYINASFKSSRKLFKQWR